MRFFLRKNATTAARRNDDETGMGQGGSTPDDGAQMTEMRQNIMRMERQMEEQSKQMQQLMTHQSDQLSAIMKTMEGEKNQERLPIECGSYELSFNGTIWSVVGVSCKEPDPDYDYFPGLAWTCDEIGKKGAGPDKIISAIIPCYNEDGKDLERTIRGLSRQILPGNWRVEVVIVMDGVEAISDTMAEYLFSLFGIHFKPKDDSIVNPFLELPDANTIIVHPCSEKSAMARYPVMEGTTGGFSLVVKKENRRKANSQQWWLGPHASAIKCKYALATDCGAFFERTTVCKLMERLDDEPAVHAVSGTQKTMPANLQGDGDFEFIHKPFHFLLRMLQRFEFEVCEHFKPKLTKGLNFFL